MLYLDNAATTAMYAECLNDLETYGVRKYYNPSAYYAPAGEAARKVSESRTEILSALGAPSGARLIFTASGSESDNIALRCCVKKKRGRVIVSALEHAAKPDFNDVLARE